MTGLVKDKVVIITGCSGGIGKDISLRFAEEGAKLTICARNEAKLAGTKELCEKAGAEVLALRCDVTDPEQLKALVEKTVERYGKIDALVNNAVSASPGTPFLETDESVIYESFNSGYLAAWRLMKLCYPYLKETHGAIVNFGSASGINGTKGYAAYGSIKEAIRGLTRTVAREWGKDGITANCICPTAVTDNTREVLAKMPGSNNDPRALGMVIPPVGFIGDAFDHIAPAVVFLCSDWAKYITGQSLRLDGGGSMTAL